MIEVTTLERLLGDDTPNHDAMFIRGCDGSFGCYEIEHHPHFKVIRENFRDGDEQRLAFNAFLASCRATLDGGDAAAVDMALAFFMIAVGEDPCDYYLDQIARFAVDTGPTLPRSYFVFRGLLSRWGREK